MKAKLLFACSLLSLSALSQSNIVWEHHTDFGASSGITYAYPNDCIEDPGMGRYVGLVTCSAITSGTAVVKYDDNTGATLTTQLYSGTNQHQWTSIRILPVNGNFYKLGTYTSNVGTLALSEINGTTGAIIFTKYIASTLTGNSPELSVADLCYDGSAYLYALGSEYNTGTSQNDVWVAKFDLAGVLQWKKTYSSTTYDENPQNIFFYNSGAIYIGGTTNQVGTPLQLMGLMMQIDNTGALIRSKDLHNYLLPNGINERMITFNIKRNLDNLYIVGQTLVGPDGAGPLLVGKLDLNMNLVTARTYTSQEGCFIFNQEFFFTSNNTKIMIPGSKNVYNALTPGYVTAFFDLNTFFLNANHLQLDDDLYGTIISYPSSNGYIFSLAQDALVNTAFYRTKGYPNTGTMVNCDDPYTFYVEEAPMIINVHSQTLVSNKALAMYSFISYVTTMTMHNDVLCYYDPLQQRLANPAASSTDIFPNPFRDELHIGAPTGQTITQIEIMDLSGRIVYEAENPAGAELVISTSGFADGVFMINMKLSDGSVLTQKLIKQ